jgi:hypothetical protein
MHEQPPSGWATNWSFKDTPIRDEVNLRMAGNEAKKQGSKQEKRSPFLPARFFTSLLHCLLASSCAHVVSANKSTSCLDCIPAASETLLTPFPI